MTDYPDKESVVGCVPLACTQIMSYHKWPEQYEGITLDWNYLNNNKISIYNSGGFITYFCPDNLSRFLAQVGKTLDTYYYAQASTRKDQVMDNFHKFGYQQLYPPKSFKNTDPSISLEDGPILTFGMRKNSDIGHCWVIDGYAFYTEKWDAIDNETHSLIHRYYHCVWGWGGESNGYFSMYDSVTLPNPEKKEDYDDTPISNTDIRKYLNLEYFDGFKPVK